LHQEITTTDFDLNEKALRSRAQSIKKEKQKKKKKTTLHSEDIQVRPLWNKCSFRSTGCMEHTIYSSKKM